MKNHSEKPIVLIVEDDKNLNRLIGKGFTLADFKIASAYTLGEALNQLHQRAFDFIVLDLGLPDGDGWNVVEAVEQAPVTSESPKVIVITGREPHTLPTGYSHQYPMLQKPVDVKELIQMTFNLRYRHKL